jgi:hypothetical protein
MKIVATHHLDEQFIGIASTLTSMQSKFFFWQKEVKPTLDMFDELKPDVLICRTVDLDQTVLMALTEYPKTKLVIFGINAQTRIAPSLICYPENLSDERIQKLNPGNIPYLKFRQAANLAKYNRGKHIETYSSDILYMSDIPDISHTLIPNVIFSLLDRKLKIVGDVSMGGVAEYLGAVDSKVASDMMASTTLAIDFLNKHYLDYAVNKVFTISSEKNDIVPMFTEESYLQDIDKYLSSDKLRNKYVKQAFDHTINGHTYFHRVKEIFDAIGLGNEIENPIKAMENLL